MKLRLTRTSLSGVVLVDVGCHRDERGFFMETWHQRDFAVAGLDLHFVQESHSRSRRGVVRGLHYQDMTAPMGKLVRCTVAAVFDVAVDLRKGSPTFGKWFSVELSADNRRLIYVPPGFGHGFQALTEGAEVQYKQTGFYAPAAEGTIAWNDPDIGVEWPLPNSLVSARDQRGRSLREYCENPAFTFNGRDADDDWRSPVGCH